MKRLLVLAAAAATLSAAIPAEAASTGARGDRGSGGRSTGKVNCLVSTKTNCRPLPPFWLP